jgi:hypothetical protein
LLLLLLGASSANAACGDLCADIRRVIAQRDHHFLALASDRDGGLPGDYEANNVPPFRECSVHYEDVIDDGKQIWTAYTCRLRGSKDNSVELFGRLVAGVREALHDLYGHFTEESWPGTAGGRNVGFRLPNSSDTSYKDGDISVHLSRDIDDQQYFDVEIWIHAPDFSVKLLPSRFRWWR